MFLSILNFPKYKAKFYGPPGAKLSCENSLCTTTHFVRLWFESMMDNRAQQSSSSKGNGSIWCASLLIRNCKTDIQFVIFKPLSYCFEEAVGFDVKASIARRPVSRLIKPGDKTK